MRAVHSTNVRPAPPGSSHAVSTVITPTLTSQHSPRFEGGAEEPRCRRPVSVAPEASLVCRRGFIELISPAHRPHIPCSSPVHRPFIVRSSPASGIATARARAIATECPRARSIKCGLKRREACLTVIRAD